MKGVRFSQLLITLGDPRVVLQFQRLAISDHRQFWLLHAVIQIAQPEQGAGAFKRRARALQGIPGGLSGALSGIGGTIALIRLLSPGLPGLAQRQPGRGLAGGGERGFIGGNGGRPVLLPGLLLGLLDQRGGGLAGRIATIADQLLILRRQHGQRRIVESMNAAG